MADTLHLRPSDTTVEELAISLRTHAAVIKETDSTYPLAHHVLALIKLSYSTGVADGFSKGFDDGKKSK